jgi:DnaJ-class molecular chaperone
MAKRAHPDAGGAENGEAFLELRRAYETLSDPAARARYDVVAGRLRLARERTGGRSGPSTRSWETDQCW